MLHLQVVTFDSESRDTTDEAALRVYHFDLDALSPHSKPEYFLSSNTLPSNTSGLCIPGFFHSEPSSRLLALEVEMFNEDFTELLPTVLCAPYDVLLGYIRSHPSDSHAVVVPWKAWGPGNAHIWTSPHLDNNRREFMDRETVCGMHAITREKVIVQGD
jgi:hypothetical protein